MATLKLELGGNGSPRLTIKLEDTLNNLTATLESTDPMGPESPHIQAAVQAGPRVTFGAMFNNRDTHLQLNPVPRFGPKAEEKTPNVKLVVSRDTGPPQDVSRSQVTLGGNIGKPDARLTAWTSYNKDKSPSCAVLGIGTGGSNTWAISAIREPGRPTRVYVTANGQMQTVNLSEAQPPEKPIVRRQLAGATLTIE